MAEPTFPTLLSNIASVVPALGQLLKGVMFLTGLFLVFRGLYALKQYGEMRTMMSSNADMKTPLILLVTGTALLFYPTLADVALNTVYGSQGYQLVPYQTDSSWSPEANQAMQDIGTILQLIGYIAFFRGWLLLTHLTSQGSPPGTFGKALTHIIAGILLVNIFGTWNIIKTTLGFTGS